MVMSLIESLTRIKNAVYGREVREAIHDGVFRANQVADGADAKADKTQIRQDAVEDFNTQVIQEMTDKDVISAPEIIAMRDGEATANDRLERDKAQLDNLELNARVHINVKEFGAVGDGLTDDAQSIQAAIDFGGDYADIYFPDGDYLIRSSLHVDNYGIAFLGGAFTRLTTDVDNMVLLILDGYNAKFHNIDFRSRIWDQSPTYNPTVTAVRCFRPIEHPLGSNASLDHTFYNCSFFNLKIGVEFKGLNIKFSSCGFSTSLFGIVGYEFNWSNPIRGITVENCRFHVMGEGYYTNNEQESWCIKLNSKKGYGNSVINNMADYNCKNFYYGPIANTNLSNNNLHKLRGHGFYILDNGESYTEPWMLQNNIISMVQVPDDRLDVESHGLVGIEFEERGNNGIIGGNVIANTRHDGIKIPEPFAMSISGNLIMTPNANQSVDGSLYAGINLLGGSNVNVYGNQIRTINGSNTVKAAIYTKTSSSNYYDNIITGTIPRILNEGVSNSVRDKETFEIRGNGGIYVSQPNDHNDSKGSLNALYLHTHMLNLSKTAAAISTPNSFYVNSTGQLRYIDDSGSHRTVNLS